MEDNRRQALLESFSTHTVLTPTDVVWATEKALEADFCRVRFAHWALLSNKKLASGQAAKRFNETLDDVVKRRSDERMNRLVKLKNAELFPELYDNPHLTSDDRNVVEQVFQRELSIVLNLIESGSKKHLLPYDEEHLPSSGKNREKEIEYEANHDMICFNENELSSPYPSQSITFFDSESRCVPREQLIDNLAKGEYVNPVTNEVLDQRIIDLLLDKYKTDIHVRQGSYIGAKPSKHSVVKTPQKLSPANRSDLYTPEGSVEVIERDGEPEDLGEVEKEIVVVESPPTCSKSTLEVYEIPSPRTPPTPRRSNESPRRQVVPRDSPTNGKRVIRKPPTRRSKATPTE